MPSRNELTRNNVRTGVFVSVSLLLTIVVVVVLTDVLEKTLRAYERYAISYTVEHGIGNLRPGSEVRVGGMPLGRVREITPKVQPGQPLHTIEVEFELLAEVSLFKDAMVFVNGPLIGADSWLEVVDVGTAERGSARGTVLAGLAGAGLLSSLLGPDADRIVTNTVEFSEFLADVRGEYEERLVPVLDDVNAVVRDLRQERWPQWAASVDEVMAWANAFSGSLDGTMSEARGLFSDGRGILAENRDGVREAIDNVRDATVDVKALAATANSQTIDRVHALLASGQKALDDATAVMASARQDYEGWAVDVGDTMANASLASQQLKLAVLEVRRSPWKLLYRPSAEELEHELLYEATRSFAMAAADLSSASESMARILDRYGEDLDEHQFARMRESLDSTFDRYRKAQEQLFDVLVTELP